MLVVLAPFQALLDAQYTEGWRFDAEDSVDFRWRRWIHAQGLECIIRPDPAWKLVFTLGQDKLSLDLARSRPEDQAFARALHDVRAWIQDLDMLPRATIAHHVGGWLTLHGKTGVYDITLMGTPTSLRADAIRRGVLDRVFIPGRIGQVLLPHLDALWTLSDTPHLTWTDITWRPWQPKSSLDSRSPRLRRLQVQLPQTQHARMELIASLMPEIRDIPFPTDPS